jgi:hypothetical protein
MTKASILAPYLVLVLFFGGLVVWWAMPTREGLKARRVTRAALSLPVGSTKNQVAALLHKEGMGGQASYISGKDLIYSSSDMSDNGYTSKDLIGYYVASIFHTSKAIIGDCGTYYCFFFDKKGGLLKVTVQDRCIGL